ncbi:MAG: glycosyltransferase [Kineothrix sp.]|nr:glycosyltransferase [Kineothrix sp.]
MNGEGRMVSVIVPVYQSAPYIDACVQSVLEQTLQDFELILVDDGSEDNTAEICQRWQASDSRIRFLAQGHKGVSAARNAGIREAKGEYLFFLDSDDAIHPELLEALRGWAKECRAAMAGCSYSYVQSASFQKPLEATVYQGRMKDRTYMDAHEALDCFIHGREERILFSIGGKLLRKDMAGPVRFDESLQNGEDTKYIYQLLLGGVDVGILHKPWYFCRQREESASHRRTPKMYESTYRAERYICDEEWRNGRKSNAKVREYCIIRQMINRYMESRQKQDQGFIDCLRNQAEAEPSLEIWGQLSLGARAEFYLAFHSAVLYKAFCYFWEMVSEHRSRIREWKKHL